jgi:hypothetical protein
MNRSLFSIAGLLAFACMIGFSGCKPDKEDPKPTPVETGTFEFKLVPTVNGADLKLDQVYRNLDNQRFTVNFLKTYVSNLRLLKADGSEVLVKDVALLDLAQTGKTDHGAGMYFTVSAPVGDYVGIKYLIGIPDSLNFNDPTPYANTHPLSVTQEMHWSWNTGYIFVRMEGTVDSAGTETGPLSRGYFYHLGRKELQREVTARNANTAFRIQKDGFVEFVNETNILEWYKNADNSRISMATQNTHSQPSSTVAPAMMDNFVRSLSFSIE